MFKDINLSIDKESIDYEYKVLENKIIVTVCDLELKKVLKIFYDENIYEIKIDENINFSNGKAGEIFIDIEEKELSFLVKLSKNFFVKTVYKYINKLIDKEMLINEINLFINSNKENNYEDLNILLNKIENENIKNDDMFDLTKENNEEFERVLDLLLNNDTYVQFARSMSELELMLLITSYISMPHIPSIDQEFFDELVNAAKNYDYSLENIWRLGMNFDRRGYNFELLDDFFANKKNVWYLGEYLCAIEQANQENIINKIIEMNDKTYIKQILENQVILDNLEPKYKNMLENLI